jgi:glycosyltransferase involved in cell wall biosynthesis
MKKHKLSVIVPVYNQDEYIYRNLHEMLKTLGRYGNDFEVILVNDGSTDNTLKEAALVKDTRLRLVSYDENKGKGFALKYGFKFAKGDVITFMDGDLDIHPKNLMNLFPYLDYADMVIGSKRHPESVVNYPLKRRVLSYFYHIFVNLLFNLKVKDTQSGFKLIKYSCLKEILPKVLVKRYAFDLELLVNAKRSGYAVAEAPIKINFNWGHKTGVNNGAIKGIFLDTLAIAYRLYVLRYYDKWER